jgi:hypothetical protein
MEKKSTIRVRLVEGTHLSKLCETGNEMHILPTCTEGKSETKNVRQVLPSTANEKIPAHLAELINTSSKNMIASQKQDLTDLLCKYQDVFSKAEYDRNIFTSVKHRIDTSESKPIRQQARQTPLNFQGKEMGHLQNQEDKELVVLSKYALKLPVVFVRKKSAIYHDCLTLYHSNGVPSGNLGPRQDQPPLWKPKLKKIPVKKPTRPVVILWKSRHPKKP